MSFKNWRGMLKVWAAPLIGIPAMLLLGYGFEVARFFLFAHHLFWIIGVILLINPMAETFWPSPARGKSKPKAALPRPSAKAQARVEARKLMAQQKPASASETLAERLARLKKQKEGINQKIEKLTRQMQKRKG